ncbi:S8 family serine peptidase [bacterium]|nr:S8 family serine peptidase [bacterium]
MRPLDSFGQRILPGLRQALQNQPGALVLCDSFEGPAAHGNFVAQVARQQGFSGKLVAVPFEDPQDGSAAEIGRLVQAWGEAETPEGVRSNLAESMALTRLSALRAATQRLLAVSEAGARNVAMNFSLGSSAAVCLAAVLDMVKNPETADQAGLQLGRAFGREVQTGLVELASRVSQDPRLMQAREDWAQAVREFESRGNSVVVAAGNDGAMRDWAPGLSRSDLWTPEVTVVGALEGGAPAAYNSEGARVLVAGGYRVAGQEVHGTSFAAPAVAARLAQLHGQFPEASSAQVETRLSLC